MSLKPSDMKTVEDADCSTTQVVCPTSQDCVIGDGPFREISPDVLLFPPVRGAQEFILGLRGRQDDVVDLAPERVGRARVHLLRTYEGH